MRFVKRGDAVIDMAVRVGVTEKMSLRLNENKTLPLNDLTLATLDTITATGAMVGRVSGVVDSENRRIVFYLPENFANLANGKRYRVRVKNDANIIDIMTGNVISEY